MARVLHLLPHPGGGGERQHQLLAQNLPEHQHEFAALAGRQDLPLALPGLLFRRPFVASRARAADLVHIDGDAVAVMSKGIVGRTPYVITTNGLHLVRRVDGLSRSVVRRRLRERVLRSRSTMCTSQNELDELRDLCGGDAPLTLVPNGVPRAPAPTPEERDAARRHFGIDDETVAAVMLARLEPRKHPVLVARAATRAHQAGTRLVLLVAGTGPQRKELERLSGPAVRLLGFLDDPWQLLVAADLFVLVSEREGMALALLEAMTAAVPVVVSDGPGNPEAVGEEAGIVVPTGDEDALVEALLVLANDEARRHAAGAASRRRVETKFSIEKMVAGVDAAYDLALR